MEQRSQPEKRGRMGPSVSPLWGCSWGKGCFSRGSVGCTSSLQAPFHALPPQIGLFDLEVNCLTKILFGALVVVSLVMVALQHFAGRWYLQIIRFLLLFSNIIPIR